MKGPTIRLALRGVAEKEVPMDRQTAMRIVDVLDGRLCWSREEFERGVKEAEAEGEEPLPNPHVFSVRLDAVDDIGTFKRDYRVRITHGVYNTDANDWQTVIDYAVDEGLSVAIQNHGIELS